MSGAPLQPAIAHALGSDDAYFTAFRTGMQAQRDQLCDGLAELGFEVFVPEGTYFATTDIRPLGFADGLEFCRRLPELAGVVAIPHQVFYDPSRPHDTAAGGTPRSGRSDNPGRPLVRWAFCKRPEVIADALLRLRRLRS
jgi:N-succinyldiaminopimelate aminotransferase